MRGYDRSKVTSREWYTCSSVYIRILKYKTSIINLMFYTCQDLSDFAVLLAPGICQAGQSLDNVQTTNMPIISGTFAFQV